MAGISIFTIRKHVVSEIIEKKSRFIANIYPITSKKEAEEILMDVKKKYWDAKHNVYSYILEGNISKYSDDGEPQGTAGLPVFNVLQNKKLQNVLIIVTRYFGGILLGKGGLVRAYSASAKKVIDEADVYEVIETKKVILTCEYNVKDKVLFDLDKKNYQKEITFGEKIDIILEIPVDEINDFTENLIKITDNKILINILSQ